jgi:hypothetical protein
LGSECRKFFYRFRFVGDLERFIRNLERLVREVHRLV